MNLYIYIPYWLLPIGYPSLLAQAWHRAVMGRSALCLWEQGAESAGGWLLFGWF